MSSCYKQKQEAFHSFLGKGIMKQDESFIRKILTDTE